MNFFFGTSKDNKVRDDSHHEAKAPSYVPDHQVGISFHESADVTRLMEGDEDHQKANFQDQQGFEGQQFGASRNFEGGDNHGPPRATVDDTAGPAPPAGINKPQHVIPSEPEMNDMDEHSPKGRRGSDFDRLYRMSNLMHGVAGVFSEETE